MNSNEELANLIDALSQNIHVGDMSGVTRDEISALKAEAAEVASVLRAQPQASAATEAPRPVKMYAWGGQTRVNDYLMSDGSVKAMTLDEAKAAGYGAVPQGVPDGMGAIAAERQRQVTAEGWSPDHDDTHSDSELALAALCYLYAGIYDPSDFPDRYWPWDRNWWKPSDNRRNLVKAGALIAAEIDRIDRAAAVTRPEGK